MGDNWQKKFTTEKITKILSKLFPFYDFYEKSETEYVSVQCPFHDDRTSSAGLKPNGWFNCLVPDCHKDMQFFDFLVALRNQDKKDNTNVYNIPNNFYELLIDDADVQKVNLGYQNLQYQLQGQQLYKITPEVLQQLQIGNQNAGELFSVPVWFEDALLGFKFYNPQKETKSWSSVGLKNGMIIPFNIWNSDKRQTFICAGEKDMLVARSAGFNAITLTGGEGAKPSPLVLNYLKNRSFVIAYDNDDAGRKGARNLAEILKGLGASVKVLGDNFHQYVPHKGGDITDLFMSYTNAKEILDWAIDNTPLEEAPIKEEKEIKLVDLTNAIVEDNINNSVTSTVQVITEEQAPSSVPGAYIFKIPPKLGFETKITCSVTGDWDDFWELEQGEIPAPGAKCYSELVCNQDVASVYKLFYFEESNMNQLFGFEQPKDKIETFLKKEVLTESRFITKEQYIEVQKWGKTPKKIKELWDNSPKEYDEKNFKVEFPKKLGDITVKPIKHYNRVVARHQVVSAKHSDISSADLNQMSQENESLEFTLYSFEPLKVNAILNITYVPVPNPFKKQVLCLLMLDKEEDKHSAQKFEVSAMTPDLLAPFVAAPQEVEQKLTELYLRYKHGKGAYGTFDLWLMNELVFHSVLWFKMTRGKNKVENDLRGVIYATIIGDTRVGKSETSNNLVKLYQQGKFISAKSATVLGLTGGTHQINGQNVIRAGELPRNNKGLVVLEEVHGIKDSNYYGQMTEIKSNNQVKLVRVSGTSTYNCTLRLIEIANPSGNANTQVDKTVATYPNGVALIKSLINAPEDIARNDLYLAVAKDHDRRPELQQYDSYQWDLLSPESYYERIKWVWSRKIDQIKFEDFNFLHKKSLELKAKFDCAGVSLLGNESDIKLARVSIALAATLASTNDNFQSIYVKNEHVEYISRWFNAIYSDEHMRIDEYVKEERTYSEVTDEDILWIQNGWAKMPTYKAAFSALEKASVISKDTLASACGVSAYGKDSGQLQTLLNELINRKLLRNDSQNINNYSPTEKFRKIIRKIDKHKKASVAPTIPIINMTQEQNQESEF